MIAKYVVTPQLEIFVFSSNVSHKSLINLNPISAGFIRFMLIEHNTVTCECFGRSESLQLESNPAMDTKLAKRFLLCEKCINCGNCENRCKSYVCTQIR